MFGLGVNRLGASRSLLGDAIANLFSNGEQGVWYDPSDLTTMLQDDTSAAPAVIGQPVGTILDKSQGLKLGSELITNGDFAADSDWVKGTGWSISGGVGVANGVTSQNLRQNGVALEENKVYSVTFTIVSISQGSVLGRFGGTTTVDSVAFNAAGTYTFFLKANSTNSSFMLRGQGGFTGTVDNVLVKEVLGNHATQPTSTKRPIYARHPEGGIRNLLNYTEQFDNGYWSKNNATITSNSILAPDGSTTAETLTCPSTGANSFVARGNMGVVGRGYTATVYAKAGTNDIIRIANVSSASNGCWYNLTSGAVGTSNGAANTAAIEDVGNGWYRLTRYFDSFLSGGNAGNGWWRVSITVQGSGSTIQQAQPARYYSGATNGTAGVYIWGAQLEEATEASNYQKVVTDIDVTESGVGEVYYLKFDGVSDNMSLTGLTSPNTPITAWFGYSATNANSTDNRLLLDIETGRTFLTASGSVGGTLGYYDGAYRNFAADSDALKVLTYDLVEDNAKIRIDGTQEYSDATYDQKAIGGQIGLFSNLRVDANHVAGNLYSCILRAAESTDKEIASTESYVAKKTGLLAQVDGIATLSLDFGGNTYTARNSNGGIL